MYMKFNLQNFFIWMLVVFSVLSRTKFSARDHRNFCWELACLWFSVHKERIDRWNFLIFQLFESCNGALLERWNINGILLVSSNSLRTADTSDSLMECSIWLVDQVNCFVLSILLPFFYCERYFWDHESSKPASNKMKPYKVFMRHIYMWIMRELWC